ncbi:MAG: hypothetical protein JOZ43_00045, partial [Acidobacteriales bacterium]|nr:hypothetical protein [Terriglobales bacterium]
MLRVSVVLVIAGSLCAQDECVPFEKAKELIGKQACITGRIVEVSESRAGNTFLNFCKNYRDCAFSAVSLNRETSDEIGDLH